MAELAFSHRAIITRCTDLFGEPQENFRARCPSTILIVLGHFLLCKVQISRFSQIHFSPCKVRILRSGLVQFTLCCPRTTDIFSMDVGSCGLNPSDGSVVSQLLNGINPF